MAGQHSPAENVQLGAEAGPYRLRVCMRQGGAQRRRGHADKNMEHVLQIILTADGQPGCIDVVRQGGKQ